MTMGQRIRQARLEAGLSQRQLAGQMMTRNMLSALEHDGANPSVGTLKYLSEKLCKPISYFLGEDFPEVREMELARRSYEAADYETCLEVLGGLGEPAFLPERKLLQSLCLLEMAEKARQAGKLPYSRQLLSQCRTAMGECPYLKAELERKWLIASALASGEKEMAAYGAKIPADDAAILLRCIGALERGDYRMAQCLLETADRKDSVHWHSLQAEVYFRQAEYGKAVQYYHKAESAAPEKYREKLEICYRELGDYKRAYEYACKQR